MNHLESALLRVDSYLQRRRNPDRQLLNLSISDTTIDGYKSDLGNLVQEFLRGGGRLSKAQFRHDMKGIIKDYAREGFRVAWEDGGGSIDETESDDIALIEEWRTEQQGFVNAFSDWLKDKNSDLDLVGSRLDSWAVSFQNFVEHVKLRAEGDLMLTYNGDDGDESCDECQEYKGQIHRLSWWEKRGLTKRNGNENFGCQRWDNCHHHFYNSKGDAVIA